MPEYANGGIIQPPEGHTPSDALINLGEREQVLYPDGRIACVYGGQLYRILNRRHDFHTRAQHLLERINAAPLPNHDG